MTWMVERLDLALANLMDGWMVSVLMRVDRGSNGGAMEDAIRQNPIRCKSKWGSFGCLMGGSKGLIRDLKSI